MHPDVTAATDPDRPAVVADDGEVRAFAQLAGAAWRVARVLRDLGLRPGDHVALLLDNRPATLEVLWGAESAGLLYTACPTHLTPDELAYVVDDCDARALVAVADLAPLAEAIVAATPKVEHRLAVGGPVAGHVPLEAATAGVPGEPWEGAVAGAPMLYSSGTTGRPKGVRPAGAGRPLRDPELFTEVTRRVLDVRPGDVYLSPAPLYHAAPLRGCMSFHRLGATVVLLRRFDARTLLELVERHRVTHTQVVPTMLVRLLRLDEDERARFDLSSLRSVVHAGAPCPPEVKRRAIEWLGPIVDEYYGGTEGCGSTWVTSAEWLERPGTVGRATVGTLHVLGPDGEELPAGETGRVFFAGGPAFEYHGDAAKTAQARTAEGWATLGDLGHLDEDGYLFLADRQAHVIITGGVNVYPREAEEVLALHPQVEDVAVVGVPDPEFGERVVAVVQPVEPPADAAAAAALEASILAFCRGRLSKVKCPTAVELRAELPRLETGKLPKRLLGQGSSPMDGARPPA
jgi:long-chain acyl-CoA synthetase